MEDVDEDEEADDTEDERFRFGGTWTLIVFGRPRRGGDGGEDPLPRFV